MISTNKMIIIMMILVCIKISGGQVCTERVNILQDGDDNFGRRRLGIVPRLSFTCNGTIIRIIARVRRDNNMDRNDYPYFQVWRPSYTDSMVYTNIGEVQLQESQVSQCNSNDYYNVNIVLTGNDRIEFQSGDVVGYYHPEQTIYRVRTIRTNGYVLYRFNGAPATTSIDLSDANGHNDRQQPLIQFVIDLQCRNLSDGELTSCSSGSIGVGYEGDTCSFICNTGYELTGSDTRTCQSNGSWSGTDEVCRRASCPLLTDPNNGTINCSLGDDGVPSYEDTCSFTCNTGYELTGSDTRTCQSDGRWSGSDDMCSRRASCPSLTDPNNGAINCSLGDDGVPFYEDTCSFTCNTGYELTGSDTRTCQSDGSWDDIETMCTKVPVGSSGDSESTGAAVGGAIGGILVFTLLVVLVLLIVFYMRRSQRKTMFSINHKSSDSKDKKNGVLGNTITVYDSIELNNQSQYEEPNYSVTDKNVSRRDGAREPMPYEVPIESIFEGSVNEYEYGCASPFELAQSMEVEQQIYVTPCEEDYGPVYQKPPSDEHKIYEEFEGKRFRKVFHKEVTSLEQLGTGEFGVVNRGMWNPSTTKKVEVAIKTLNTNSTAKDRLRFLQEAVIMCQFDHENVIKLYGVVTDAPAMIVLEYMSHGDLRNVLLELPPNGGKPIPEKLPFLLLKFCKEISAGMTYLSGKKFIHRDLAARNVLVSEQFKCKIADFGMSRDLLDDNYYVTSGGKIPVKWTAPEAIYYRKYSLYSDVWSYGCVLYEIWSLGHKPFENMPTSQAMLEKLEIGYRLPPPPGCPRVLYRIMIKCWNPDPKLRPQFGQIAKLLASNSGYLLSWSDEDKQIGGEEAMKLGGTLETGNNLFYDLQCTYK